MNEGLGRKKRRFHVQLPVRVVLRSAIQPFGRLTTRLDRTEQAFTQNISASGCYIRVAKEMPIGSVIELEIALPAYENGEPGGFIHCHAVVVRLHPEPAANKVGVGCRIQHFRFQNSSRQVAARSLVASIGRALSAVVPAPPEMVRSTAAMPQHAS